ncbi:MAG: ABC transporter permease [Clostridiales bacterium]|jgi:spermidine/putrescine transport system permease protein|nr:ABC transporter permease [Clostridiales bacterium]
MSFKLKKRLALAFVWLVLALMYVPILILVIYSFTDSRSMSTWNGFTFYLYVQMISDSEIMSALANTLVIAVSSSLLAMLIGTVSAVGIFYLKVRARAAANLVNQITVINADIVTAVAFMVFFVRTKLLPDGYATLILTHTMITIPYVVLSVTPKLARLDPNLYDAGQDLGAGAFRSLVTVVFPQLIPGMISGFALAFTLSLDDFVITKLNNGGTVDTISTYLYTRLAKKGVKPVLRALSAAIFIVSLIILVSVNVYSKRKAKRAFGIK